MARKAKISNTNSEAEARKDTYEWLQILYNKTKTDMPERKRISTT